MICDGLCQQFGEYHTEDSLKKEFIEETTYIKHSNDLNFKKRLIDTREDNRKGCR
jgi:hypothetical protein